MEGFHGIIVNKSLKDISIIENFNIISEEVDGSWILYKLSVKDNELSELIRVLQENMVDGAYYAHFYNQNGSKLVVVFKERTFIVTSNKETWTEIIRYGRSLNIPMEQLDFVPNKFEDEK